MNKRDTATLWRAAEIISRLNTTDSQWLGQLSDDLRQVVQTASTLEKAAIRRPAKPDRHDQDGGR